MRRRADPRLGRASRSQPQGKGATLRKALGNRQKRVEPRSNQPPVGCVRLPPARRRTQRAPPARGHARYSKCVGCFARRRVADPPDPALPHAPRVVEHSRNRGAAQHDEAVPRQRLRQCDLVKGQPPKLDTVDREHAVAVLQAARRGSWAARLELDDAMVIFGESKAEPVA